MLSIGKKIKKIREIKGFKQEYMAGLLNISQQSYSNIESGKIDISFSRIAKIAEAFDMLIEDLISFNENHLAANSQTHESEFIFESHFSKEIKDLYEDKIRLYEDKVSYLTETIYDLKERLRKEREDKI